MLLTAATRLEPIDGDLARETYLEALLAGMWVGHLGDASNSLTTAAQAARRGPRGPLRAPVEMRSSTASRSIDGGLRSLGSDPDRRGRVAVRP